MFCPRDDCCGKLVEFLPQERSTPARALAFGSLVLVSFRRANDLGDFMQSTKPSSLSLTSPAGSSVVDVLDRMIAIAPALLLPGEKEADYAAIAGRMVGVSRPRDAIEEVLIRDVIDLTWEVFRLRRIRPDS
jgi:hypothetical protein